MDETRPGKGDGQMKTAAEEVVQQPVEKELVAALDLLYKHGMPEGARIILRELVARKKALEEK